MPAQISWLVENHIIYWLAEGLTTIEEIKEAEAKVLRMFQESPAALVHIVFDMQDVTEMPKLSENIRAKFEFPLHPKCGWSILIGIKDPVQKMIVSILGGIFKARMRMLPSNLIALEFLESIDANLPDVQSQKEKLSVRV
jgi:hypothetical protein